MKTKIHNLDTLRTLVRGHGFEIRIIPGTKQEFVLFRKGETEWDGIVYDSRESAIVSAAVIIISQDMTSSYD